MTAAWLDRVRFDAAGLVPAIAQDATSGKVLTLAWMNREALERTAATREAHYWSRSRAKLWRKGESSGHVQRVREIRLDCDDDAILLVVEQGGGIACHTGRERCFFLQARGRRLARGGAGAQGPEGDLWRLTADPTTCSRASRGRSSRGAARNRRRPTRRACSRRAATRS